ncbi:hypothetical protein [Leadbettera azotonutricia]|uniref:Uncharacterized protein n=1 Tax=Leadbettera azotonutricia (strain ATCC BAA-888 / DSM 13862 / ZAS-9) TaxID=545695 RepID=F5YAR6_LEAAZ|nr:hypothetical protein [Leadbettera azotonutricia]AEF83049.1 hypothetical protein TREAZ_1938 [Leadbettera azotonutricia ZAS-9]
MSVQGRDCCITLKTQYREMGLPYSEETIREAVSILKEEAAIEGDGNCGAIRRSRGVTGCVVTPLSIETAPLLFVLALGRSGLPAFVSGTRVLYRHTVNLSAMESGLRFDLIQDRGAVRTLYEGCRVKDFELRIMRGEAIKLKLDIAGNFSPVCYPYPEKAAVYSGERFKEDGVKYRINGTEYKNIYGLTIATRKDGGTQTEVRIHRTMNSAELPPIIETLEITAQLLHDHYDYRLYGAFRLNLSRLVLMADETAINAGDTVIGPLRYYCAGDFSADVFTTSEEVIE